MLIIDSDSSIKTGIGAGNTIWGMEFIYNGIARFDEPGIIVVFEVSPDKLIRDAAKLGWDFVDLQARKKLRIIFISPQVLDHEMRSPDSLRIAPRRSLKTAGGSA